jgi:hypothetical protein
LFNPFHSFRKDKYANGCCQDRTKTHRHLPRSEHCRTGHGPTTAQSLSENHEHDGDAANGERVVQTGRSSHCGHGDQGGDRAEYDPLGPIVESGNHLANVRDRGHRSGAED